MPDMDDLMYTNEEDVEQALEDMHADVDEQLEDGNMTEEQAEEAHEELEDLQSQYESDVDWNG